MEVRRRLVGRRKVLILGDGTAEVSIAIDHDITEPTAGQVRVLQALLDQRLNVRHGFEKAVFKHYQESIYGTVSECGKDDQWEELTPKLEKPQEIWKVLCEPTVLISYIGDDEPQDLVEFRFSFFSCPWDEEHGFGVEIRNWKIISFGGEVG